MTNPSSLPFTFDRVRRTIEANGITVRIPHKVCAVLQELISHRGEVVSPADLLRRVWAGRTVDPANVKVQISNLRLSLRRIHLATADLVIQVPTKGWMLAG